MYEIIVKSYFIFTHEVLILLFISKFLLASFSLPFPYFPCAWRISFNVSFSVDLLVMNSVSCHLSEKFFISALISKDIFSEYRILDYSFSLVFFTTLEMLLQHLMAYIFSRKNISSYTFSLYLKHFLLITSFKEIWNFFTIIVSIIFLSTAHPLSQQFQIHIDQAAWIIPSTPTLFPSFLVFSPFFVYLVQFLLLCLQVH